jgi:hypothetical protein
MKEFRSAEIIPIGICILPWPNGFSGESVSPCDAVLSNSPIADDKPIANGSTVVCHPAKVVSTQSVRAKATLPVLGDCGKKVASLSHSSAIESACSTSETSFAPIGAEPCAVANFFAVSRTRFFGNASVEPPKPEALMPSFENCS